MRRTALIVLAVAGGLCALVLIAAAIAVATVDLRTLVSPVLARVEAATGRPLTVRGPIDLKLSLEPRIVIDDVAFGNASWSSEKDMLRVKRVEAQMALLPLIHRQFEVVEIVLTEPVITLETDAQGRRNWDFSQARADTGAKPAPSSPAAALAGALNVGAVTIGNGTLTYRDASTGKTTRVAIERLALRTRGNAAPVDAEFRGKVDDVALAFTGNVGPLDALRAGRWPLPFTAEGEVQGKPARVTSKLTAAPDAITLDDLDMAIGAFSAKGELSVLTSGKRSTYRFRLEVPSVALTDLPVPVATASAAPAASKSQAPASRYMFSDARLPVESLRAFDAEGQISIASLALNERLKLAPFTTRITLTDGKLDLSDLSMGVVGGSLRGRVTVNASRGDAAALAIKMDGQGLDLPAILAVADVPRHVRGGKTTLAIDVTGNGASAHAWASTASGNVTITVGPATLVNTKLDIDNSLDKLAQAVNPFRQVDPSTELQCAVVRLPLSNGIARVDRSIGADTQKIGVTASGSLDFRNETLDLALRPKVKQGISIDIPQIAQLVRFTGPFQHPGIAIDAVASAETIAKIGAAIGTSGLSVLGTSLIQQVGPNESACDIALGRKTPTDEPDRAAQEQKPAANPRDLPNEIGKALGKLFGR